VPLLFSCNLSPVMVLQVVAYNKIDLPDSGDYIEEVHGFLLGRGLAPEDVHAMSAVTGQGVLGVVRRARELLDQLPSEVSPSLAATPCVRAEAGSCSGGFACSRCGERAARAGHCQKSSEAPGLAGK
jgi:hypothetical protein